MIKETREGQFHRAYMHMALIVADLSYCSKRKVGAVIVNGKNIEGYGFNGTVSGLPNVCEDDRYDQYDKYANTRDVHAEMNAVIKAGHGCKGASIYVTCYPCEPCARHMAQAGICTVYYMDDHNNNKGQVERYGMNAVKIVLN